MPAKVVEILSESEIRRSLGCPMERTHYLQDFYHVTEHLANEC